MFADRAPFTELPEGIEIKGLVQPFGMVASAANRSIFIHDFKIHCIWKIQMPRKELSRWYISPETPMSMSITPNMELLISVWGYIWNNADFSYDSVDITDILYYKSSFYRLTDGSKTRSVSLPEGIKFVSCAAELPNKNFVICFHENISRQIGVLSMDDNHLTYIRTLDLASFKSIQDKRWNPYFFTVTDNGELFFAESDRIIWFNSNLTDYCIISNNDYPIAAFAYIYYINGKQQLLVSGGEVGGLENVSFVTVLYLSPCSLDKERSSGELVEKKIKLNRKHLVYDFTAKYKKIQNTKILTN